MNDYLISLIGNTLKTTFPELTELPEIQLQKPKSVDHGDIATNVALMLAKPLGKNPRQIAQAIADNIALDSTKLAGVEIAGPGFINFRFAGNYLVEAVTNILNKADQFGKTELYKDQKIQVEFVSANPTGPLTVGHGRNAVLGDTIARLYEWNGATVSREYYFNNAGRQMRVLGQSVQARYNELLNKEFAFPEGGYEGEYIIDIAKTLVEENGESLLGTEDFTPFKNKAEEVIFHDIKTTLKRMSIKMDTFYNENSLYENKAIDRVVSQLEEKGLVYKKDGAVWLKTTEFGKEKDTVLIKSTGEPTYRLPDIAYHITKLERGFDKAVDIFGADHIDTYPDVKNAVKALGYDETKIDVLVYQFVTIVKDGKPFKMSTRKANFITLDELMDEAGSDVTRFFFLMRSPNTHLEFDIAQAKEAGDKNPVFYLQYAHARIKSILRKAEEVVGEAKDADLSLLTHEAEENLIKELMRMPQFIQQAAEAKEPQKLIYFLNDIAASFTTFYHDCRILGIDEELGKARLALATATAHVIKNGLRILGITAPEQM